MSRLTEKYGKYGRPYCFNCKEEVRFDNDIVRQMLYKLGRLEDLEEQLGCPLEVLSKVIENGFYDNYCYIPPSRILRIDIFNKEILKMYYDEATSCFSVKLTDYKKTWWLKEDKSE